MGPIEGITPGEGNFINGIPKGIRTPVDATKEYQIIMKFN